MDDSQCGYEVDFLPVGDGERSGDAIAMRWGYLHADPPEQTVVIIDAGYAGNGKDVVKHVTKHYGTQKVDLVVSTHPHADHIAGLSTVLQELNVFQLAMHCPWLPAHTNGIADLFQSGRVTNRSVRDRLKEGLDAAYDVAELARRRGTRLCSDAFSGARLNQHGGVFTILGPSKEYYESLLPQFRCTPTPIANIYTRSFSAEGSVQTRQETIADETLAEQGETSAENDSGIISMLSLGDKRLLFTGDAGRPALMRAIKYARDQALAPAGFSFVQIPHHGSVHNVSPRLLDFMLGPKQQSLLETRVAFASVSADGGFKHPSKRVTNAFLRRGTRVCKTAGAFLQHYFNAPARPGWGPAPCEPLHPRVEIYD